MPKSLSPTNISPKDLIGRSNCFRLGKSTEDQHIAEILWTAMDQHGFNLTEAILYAIKEMGQLMRIDTYMITVPDPDRFLRDVNRVKRKGESLGDLFQRLLSEADGRD